MVSFAFHNVLLTFGALIGLALFGAGLHNLWVSRDARAWVPVTATILTSRVASRVNSGHSATYFPQVAYRYTYNGVEFEATRIRLLETDSSFKRFAEAAVLRYAPRKQVIAFVNPARPKDALLERSPQTVGLLAVTFCGLALAGSMAYALLESLGLVK